MRRETTSQGPIFCGKGHGPAAAAGRRRPPAGYQKLRLAGVRWRRVFRAFAADGGQAGHGANVYGLVPTVHQAECAMCSRGHEGTHDRGSHRTESPSRPSRESSGDDLHQACRKPHPRRAARWRVHQSAAAAVGGSQPAKRGHQVAAPASRCNEAKVDRVRGGVCSAASPAPGGGLDVPDGVAAKPWRE